MPHPVIRCQHCGHIFVVQSVSFTDRASFEDSDISTVKIVCPACDELNEWKKDEVLNVDSFPAKKTEYA